MTGLPSMKTTHTYVASTSWWVIALIILTQTLADHLRVAFVSPGSGRSCVLGTSADALSKWGCCNRGVWCRRSWIAEKELRASAMEVSDDEVVLAKFKRLQVHDLR